MSMWYKQKFQCIASFQTSTEFLTDGINQTSKSAPSMMRTLSLRDKKATFAFNTQGDYNIEITYLLFFLSITPTYHQLTD